MLLKLLAVAPNGPNYTAFTTSKYGDGGYSEETQLYTYILPEAVVSVVPDKRNHCTIFLRDSTSVSIFEPADLVAKKIDTAVKSSTRVIL